ncbi:SRPBCC domain-containing protein [Candidatus Saccharibacteria bacterium]|nr:SRPBCC domain-containing protein [Candidatus Saccharibacteria bacterium]
MVTNVDEVIINADIQTVWQALTTTEGSDAFLKVCTVETDWRPGSAIVYTATVEDPGVQEANNEMRWEGTIAALEPHREFSCTYDPQKTGMYKESYFLDRLEDGRTKVRTERECISQEVADAYAEAGPYTTEQLKLYAERIAVRTGA